MGEMRRILIGKPEGPHRFTPG